MAFCRKCGKRIPDDSKFCPNCGASVDNTLDVNVETENDADEAPTRRQVFVGLVRKCPSCGEELSPGVAICPTCGFELNTKKGSMALEDFVDQLSEVDEEIAAEGVGRTVKGWSSWGGWKRFGWVVLNIYTLCLPIIIPALLRWIRILFVVPKPKLTANESRKAEIIENYVIPNEKEALTESLRFIRTKVEALKRQSNDEKLMYWMNLWKVKAGQIFSKASKSVGDDKEIASNYKAINRIVKGSNTSMRIGAGIKTAIVIFIIYFIVSGIANLYATPSLGLKMAVVSNEQAKEYNLESEGVYVTELVNRKAKKAGFQKGDRIVSIDGREIKSSDDYADAMRYKSVGRDITVVISRDGKQYKINAKVVKLK